MSIAAAAFWILSASAQERAFRIEGQQITVLVEDTSADEDTKETSLSVYLKNRSEPLLAVLLTDCWADSNSRSVMVGDYDVTDSTFVLYHFWAKAGDAPVSPYGARIQTYGLEKDSFVLKDSRLYIETMSEYYVDQYRDKENLGYHAGVVYLQNAPRNATEQQELNAYIQGVEQEYDARFVRGKEADRLMATVRKRLAADLQRYTGDWQISFKESGFGYKK